MTDAPGDFKFDGFDPGKLGNEWWRPKKLLQAAGSKFGIGIAIGLVVLVIESPLKLWLDINVFQPLGDEMRAAAQQKGARAVLDRMTSAANESRILKEDMDFYRIGRGRDLEDFFNDNVLGDLPRIENVLVDLHLGNLLDHPERGGAKKDEAVTPYKFVTGKWAEPSPGYTLVQKRDGTFGLISTRAINRAASGPPLTHPRSTILSGSR